MSLNNFLVFDVETATQDRSSICQIGYVIVKNLTIVDSKSYLIQPPENEYVVMNSNIHGLSALDTKESPLFPEIWKEIEKDFKSNILVAHNAAFDTGALVAALKLYGIIVPNPKYVCTYELTDLNLKALCESLEVEFKHHHDALNDAVACAKSLIKILKGVEPNKALITKEETKNPFAFEGHERLSGDILKPNLNVKDKENPFFSKKVVLTGVLKSISRSDAAKILKEKGADIDTGVTKRTNFVIAGSGAGPSKLKKIDLFNEGGADIKVLNEKMFLKMIS